MPSSLTHRRFQCRRDLLIEERQQLVAAINDPDLGTQSGEGTGIFAADDSCTDDGHRAGKPLELEYFVGVMNPVMFERKARRTDRRGAGGDQDDIAPEEHIASTLADRIWGSVPAG